MTYVVLIDVQLLELFFALLLERDDNESDEDVDEEEREDDDPMTAEPPLDSPPMGLNPTNRPARRRELPRRLRDYVTGEELDGVNAIAITGSGECSTCQSKFATRTNYRHLFQN